MWRRIVQPICSMLMWNFCFKSAELYSALHGPWPVSVSVSVSIPNLTLMFMKNWQAVWKCLCVDQEIKHCGDYLKVTRLISHFARCLCWLSSEGMNITCWVGCSNWLWNRTSSALHFLMWSGLQCQEHCSPREMGWLVCLLPLPRWHNTSVVSCSNRLDTHSGLKLTWQNWFVVIRTNSQIWLTLWLHLWQREVKGCTEIFVCRKAGARKSVLSLMPA